MLFTRGEGSTELVPNSPGGTIVSVPVKSHVWHGDSRERKRGWFTCWSPEWESLMGELGGAATPVKTVSYRWPRYRYQISLKVTGSALPEVPS